MLSAASRPYIEASVPVLREHGLAITQLFYRNMFAEHPELENLFNMGNQANGLQQRSLASAVFAYAANYDNSAALAPVLRRIAHKHASVGLTSAHYPIVGRHLLAAIAAVLGEAATPELLAAWDEAYWLLAGELIAAEARLYERVNEGAEHLQPMKVLAVNTESALVKSYTLVPADGAALPVFRPGQYVSVGVQLPNGLHQLRQYSLSDSPLAPHLRISVKREIAGAETPAGVVSNWLHDHLQAGSILPVSKPFGDFLPETQGDAPIVLLSGGIGVTPMMAALNHIAAVAPQRRVLFAHAARDPDHHPHRADLEKAKACMPNLQSVIFYEEGGNDGSERGRMQLAKLPRWETATTDVYLCGPLPFMQAQWIDLVAHGVPVQRLHREVFGPDLLDHLL